MKIKTRIFNPLTATSEEWSKFHRFRMLYHDKNKPDDSFTSDEDIEKIRKVEMNDNNYITVLNSLEYSDKIIGMFSEITFNKKNPSYNSNKDLLLFDIQLLNEYRRKGIGTKILEKIIQYAKNHNKTNLLVQTQDEDGKKFLKGLNFESSLTQRESRLYLKELDWEMINSWKEEGEKLNPETKILIFNKIPEEILESYCKTYSFTNNQAPREGINLGDLIITPESIRIEEEQLEKQSIIKVITVSLEKEGTVSGLTELTKVGTNDEVFNQGLTGVLIEYRGKKLGKYLKAFQLLYLKGKYPKLNYIKTSNAYSNAPMLSINTRLGFKEYAEKIYFQTSLEDFILHVNRKKDSRDSLIEIYDE